MDPGYHFLLDITCGKPSVAMHLAHISRHLHFLLLPYILSLFILSSFLLSRPPVCLPRRSCQGFMHMKFTHLKDGKYVLGQNSPPFDTIPEVIHFYTTHKLPIRGAEHLSLLFPVLVQTL